MNKINQFHRTGVTSLTSIISCPPITDVYQVQLYSTAILQYQRSIPLRFQGPHHPTASLRSCRAGIQPILSKVARKALGCAQAAPHARYQKNIQPSSPSLAHTLPATPQIKATTKIGIKYGTYRTVPWSDEGHLSDYGHPDGRLNSPFLRPALGSSSSPEGAREIPGETTKPYG